MKIRILQSFMVSPFAGYNPGQIIEADGGVADYWISRGLAEEVVETTSVKHQAAQTATKKFSRIPKDA